MIESGPKLPGAMCDNCPLKDEAVVRPFYPMDPWCVFVGEAPGSVEVVKGKPFVGPSGELLRRTVQAYGKEDTWAAYTNVVMCRPPGNRTPTPEEVACCAPRLKLELEKYPDLPVGVLGGTASGALMGWDNITKIRGKWEGRLFPTFHPAYVLRMPKEAATFYRDIEKFIRGPNVPIYSAPDPEPYYVTEMYELKEFLDDSEKCDIAFDFETDQVNWRTDNAILLTMNWDNGYSLIIPGRHPDLGESQNLLYNPECIAYLNKFWSGGKRRKLTFIGHSAKFDMHFGRTLGLDKMYADEDTLLMHYTLDERRGTHDLKLISRYYMDVRDYETEFLKKYLHSRNDLWSNVPFQELSKYAALDSRNTRLIKEIMKEELIAEGLYDRPYRGLLMPAHEQFFTMEHRGFMVDIPALKKAEAILEDEMEMYHQKLIDLSGDPDINPNSTQQIAHVLYDIRGAPPPPPMIVDRKKGNVKINPRSTSKVALAHMAILDEDGEIIGYTDDVADTLFKYRRSHKILSSYVQNLLEQVDPEGRVHFIVQIHGTETGRISIVNPALQTIPRESTDRYGAMIRSCFIARPGYVLIDADYSQAEIRIFAAVTMDPFLLRVYRDKRDLHTEVCIAAFGEDWKKEQRMSVKNFNFGFIYGAGMDTLSRLGLPQHEVQRFKDTYTHEMRVAIAWRVAQGKLVHETGEVVSYFNRRRRYPLICNENKIDAEHSAINMPVQGPASDLTTLSAIELEKQGLPVLLVIHDGLIVEVPESQAEEAKLCVQRTMEETATKYFPQIPWKADVEIKRRWGEQPDFLLNAG